MKYCIIPAAGGSTRMRELGKQYAKTVLPYKGKPIIAHIVENVKAEVRPDEIIVVYGTDEHREQIEEALSLFGHTVTFMKCKDGRQGPAKSILSGIPDDVDSNDELFVHLSDFVASDEYLNLPVDTIATFDVYDHRRWCMVSADSDGRIVAFHDKPKENVEGAVAVAGLYRFSNALKILNIGEFLENTSDSEFQISELMEEYAYKNPLFVKKNIKGSVVDFGTIEEFNQNRGIAKARSFNDIVDHGNYVAKISHENPEKIFREAEWMRNLPKQLYGYAPAVYEIVHKHDLFLMEKIKSNNLRDVYLFIDRTEQTWDEIFNKVYTFNQECATISKQTNSFWEMIIKKTIDRSPGGKRFDAFLDEFSRTIRQWKRYDQSTFYHGDLHFANMFYCFNYKELKLIDPRGEYYGHWFYDIAKLNHSVNGRYDWIDSQLYTGSKVYNRGTEGVEKSFGKFIDRIGLDSEDRNVLNLLTASLFLSMIPLHTHSAENQRMYLEEFWRLYNTPVF